jgi:hypothetical protein
LNETVRQAVIALVRTSTAISLTKIKFGSREINIRAAQSKTLIIVSWDIGSIYLCHTLFPILSSYWLALVQALIQSGQVTVTAFQVRLV